MGNRVDEVTVAWLGREFHPKTSDDKAVYLFLERPTKGTYGGMYYFWRVSDPSYKIRVPAGLAAHLGIQAGDLHPILQKVEGIQR
jgi:hypothetical protein